MDAPRKSKAEVLGLIVEELRQRNICSRTCDVGIEDFWLTAMGLAVLVNGVLNTSRICLLPGREQAQNIMNMWGELFYEHRSQRS